MIKLLENGTLKVLRTYTSVEEARFDVIWKSSEKYLVEYNDNEICELLSNSQCEKCIFYYEETEECVKTVFIEGALGELE